MKIFEKYSTPNTPFVSFDPDHGKFKLEGRSIPENPGEKKPGRRCCHARGLQRCRCNASSAEKTKKCSPYKRAPGIGKGHMGGLDQKSIIIILH